MPCRWSETPLANFKGTIRSRRRFGYPGRIDEYERVWLTFDGVTGSADIFLNCTQLGRQTDGRFEFDVTSILHERNEVIVDIEDDSGCGGLWGEVAMEVRCLAWLKDVRVRMVNDDGRRLLVDGIVAGSSDRPLDLYVVLDRSPLIYALVTPTAEGAPFHLHSEPFSKQQGDADVPVRVELVHGAVAWYTMDLACDRSALCSGKIGEQPGDQ